MANTNALLLFFLLVTTKAAKNSYSSQSQENDPKSNVNKPRATIRTERPSYPHPVYKNDYYKEPVEKKVEFVPGIGEVVLQDRFEPRPLFAYRKQQQQQPIQPDSPSSETPKDLYQSPYSSYNPPKFVPDENPKFLYPPNDGGQSGVDTTPSKSENVQDSATFGPPFAPTPSEETEFKDHNNVVSYDEPDEGNGDQNTDYYPPEEERHGPPSFRGPPPSFGHEYSFPQYLYDHHHHDNHIYEEIPHTTMAPVKEKKRVSGTHYSYYYLGRKLWYIPLYFSIYFIIYVTVLIVKSIARHKVNLKYKYKWEENARQMKSLDIDRKLEIDDVHHNVTSAILRATEKYSDVLKM